MHRMFTRIFFFTILFSCLLLPKQEIKAQGTTPSLRVSQLINFPSLPDTIYEGVPYDSIGIVVVNDDSIPYQGAISVAMLADSSIFPVYLSFSPAGVFLLPGDSIIYFVSNYFFDPATFREGGNIVVVWPVANVNVSDTLATDVYYVHISGIEDVYSPSELNIQPNPATGEITIVSTTQVHLEQVRIYAVDGKLISHKLNENKIDISSLAPGVYYVYFLHRKGVSIRKLIKY